jgi:chromosome segregation ATPase
MPMDRDDRDSQVESATGGDRSAAALRGAICRAAERLGALEAERCALADLRDNAEMYRRDLEGRLAEARRALARMQAAVDACHRRTAELQAEAGAAAQENQALERRQLTLVRRLDALTAEADALAGEQRRRRDAAATIGSALEELCDTLVRIDEKIRFADRKREAGLPAAAPGAEH